MHVALQTRDILDDIFECMSPSSQLRGRNAFHECALVCKAFSEPALERLWMHVPCFDVLLALLPSSAKVVLETVVPNRGDIRPQNVKVYAHIHSIWIMEGPIAEAERARFIWYARRIRILHMDFARRIDPSVFEHLLRAGLGSPLLPRLHTLRGRWWEFSGLPLESAAVMLLSGPALRSLCIGFPNPYPLSTAADDEVSQRPVNVPTIRDTLAHVAVSAPGLESLAVRHIPCISLLEPIGALHNLRRLDLSMLSHSFDVGFLRTLVTLVRLEDLILPDAFVAQDATPCKGFKSVQKLTIRPCLHMFTVPDLFAALPDLRLKELHMDYMTCERVDQIRALAEALCAGPGQCLERLNLFYYECEDQISTSTQVSVSVLLAPFYALQSIRRLNLDSVRPLMFEDEDLRKMGRAWPRLEQLHMWGVLSSAGGEAVVAPTIEGIVELANVSRAR